MHSEAGTVRTAPYFQIPRPTKEADCFHFIPLCELNDSISRIWNWALSKRFIIIQKGIIYHLLNHKCSNFININPLSRLPPRSPTPDASITLLGAFQNTAGSFPLFNWYLATSDLWATSLQTCRAGCLRQRLQWAEHQKGKMPKRFIHSVTMVNSFWCHHSISSIHGHEMAIT